MKKATKIYQCCKLIDFRFKEWADDPHDIPLPPDYYLAVEELIELADLGRDIKDTLPEAFFPVRFQAGIQKLDVYYQDYIHKKSSRPNSNPSADFFSQINHVVAQVLDWPNLHTRRITVDTVQNLHRQGLYPNQIALMYGLKHEASGEGRGDLIEQELAAPGSIIGPNYVHPNETKRKSFRSVIANWVNESMQQIISEVDVKQEAIDLDDIKTLAQARSAGLSVKSASSHLGLPESQVQSFYDNEENLEDSKADQNDDSEDPDWARGISFENLCLKAKDLGIVTRKSMKRSTVISKIEEATANAAN